MKTTTKKRKDEYKDIVEEITELESKMKYYTKRYTNTIWASVVIYALTILYLMARIP
jgi:hypothetical protein